MRLGVGARPCGVAACLCTSLTAAGCWLLTCRCARCAPLLTFRSAPLCLTPAGKWTVQQAADLGVPAPTIAASLDGRYISSLRDERLAAADFYTKQGLAQPAPVPGIDKAQLVADVKAALYASKVCSYAQGMAIIKSKSDEKGWGVNMGGLARIWKVGRTPHPDATATADDHAAAAAAAVHTDWRPGQRASPHPPP